MCAAQAITNSPRGLSWPVSLISSLVIWAECDECSTGDVAESSLCSHPSLVHSENHVLVCALKAH